jgi:transcription antitermination factor NusG
MECFWPWFALKVRSRNEAVTGSLLAGKGYEAFVPSYVDCRVYSDRIKKVDAALFPGYVFCRLDPEKRLPVLKTPGVEYILTLDGVPAAVPEDEIAAIQRITKAGVDAKPWPYLKAGHKVRVEFGAFTGLEGLFVEERGVDRLVVSVTLLQRSVSVEIDRTWIRPIDTNVAAALPIPERYSLRS